MQELLGTSRISGQLDDLKAWCHDYHLGLLERELRNWISRSLLKAWCHVNCLGLQELPGAAGVDREGKTKDWVPRSLRGAYCGNSLEQWKVPGATGTGTCPVRWGLHSWEYCLESCLGCWK